MPPRVSGRDAEMEHSEGDSAKEQQRQHVGDRRYERIGKDGGVDVNGFCQDRDATAYDFGDNDRESNGDADRQRIQERIRVTEEKAVDELEL